MKIKEKYKSSAYWTKNWQLDLMEISNKYSVEELSKLLDIEPMEAQMILDAEWNGSISKFNEYVIKLGYSSYPTFKQLKEYEALERLTVDTLDRISEPPSEEAQKSRKRRKYFRSNMQSDINNFAYFDKPISECSNEELIEFCKAYCDFAYLKISEENKDFITFREEVSKRDKELKYAVDKMISSKKQNWF